MERNPHNLSPVFHVVARQLLVKSTSLNANNCVYVYSRDGNTILH